MSVIRADAPPIALADAAGLSLDGKWLVRDVSFALRPGELVALVGPNGAGKSTMLGLLAGDLAPSDGRVLLAGQAPHRARPRELALRRAVMLQGQRAGFAYSVAETVELGRLVHRDASPEEDARAVRRALEESDLTNFADRDVTTLSGGEAARAAYARVLAQETPLVLLDEPTAALDLRHQEALMGSAAGLAEQGACVVAVVHDLTLAARYAHRVLVFSRGALVADGPPSAVLTPALIEQVYGQPVHVLAHPETGSPVIVPAGTR